MRSLEGNKIHITIDGPAGAGKSTIAQLLAQKLNYIYIDTGAMYRAVAWLALQEQVAPEDENALGILAEAAKLHFTRDDKGQQQVWLNDMNITLAIRRPEITRFVSKIASVAEVRNALVSKQRALAQFHDVVMDGRDAGTVVLPDAQLKIYLTASVEARARRRQLQQKAQGVNQPLESLINDIATRDLQDQSRAMSPLKPAEDALILDNTEMSIEDTIRWILDKLERIV